MATPIPGLPTFTRTLTPSLWTNDASEGTVAWSNPANATHASDFASVTLAAGAESQNLHGHTCDWGLLPRGARVVSVKVDYERRALLALGATTRARLQRAGGPPGILDEIDIVWSLLFGAELFGSSDADWGQSMAAANVRGDAFGVKLRVGNTAVSLGTTYEIRGLTIDVGFQLPVVTAQAVG